MNSLQETHSLVGEIRLGDTAPEGHRGHRCLEPSVIPSSHKKSWLQTSAVSDAKMSPNLEPRAPGEVVGVAQCILLLLPQ